MTRLIRRGFIAGACVALSWTAPRVVRAQQPAVDVSGRWSLSIRTPDGEERRTLDLVMAKNGAITGSITAPLGTLDLSAGKLVGDSLHIEFAMAGGQIRVTYDGVVKSDSVRGVYRQEGYSGAFVG